MAWKAYKTFRRIEDAICGATKYEHSKWTGAECGEPLSNVRPTEYDLALKDGCTYQGDCLKCDQRTFFRVRFTKRQ